MPDRWLTFAPIGPHWVIHHGVALPYQFSNDVSLRAIPDWVWKTDAENPDPLREQIDSAREEGERDCIAIEYEADDLNARQISAADEVFSVHLAMWLSHPTALSFQVIVHARQASEQEWVTRLIAPYNRAIALDHYATDQLTAEDLARAKSLFEVLRSVSRDGPIRMASQAMKKALVEGSWEIRFFLLWLVIECLFGPEDGREISYRLSLRVALFVEPDATRARELSARIKRSYGWRSKIVHGLRLTRLNQSEREALLSELEELVRRALLAVLGDPAVVARFDGDEREEYLDTLVFH